MINRETIEKLKQNIGYGDQGRIARLAGVSKVTVNRFFNGKEDFVTDSIRSKIVEATNDLINNVKGNGFLKEMKSEHY